MVLKDIHILILIASLVLSAAGVVWGTIKFVIPNLVSEVIEEDIGHIWYYAFQNGGAQQLDKEIQKLIEDGAKGLILDMRYNPGGVVDDAVEVCDLFLDEGIIVTTRERMEDKEII